MKVYSIGREAGCDIVIHDNTDVVSRRHAVLNVSSSGKMTIMDQSHNGTYVNGIRISPNVPVPVTRKDNISFAHIARLDWNLVPKSDMALKYIGAAVVVILIGVACFFGYDAINDRHGDNPKVLPTDSIKPKTEKDIRKEIQDSITREKAKQDSIKREKIKQDSIQKVKTDSINKAKRDSKNKIRNGGGSGKPKPVQKDTTKIKKPTKFR